jgi:tetratricopeptide (TPR) repeat protein
VIAGEPQRANALIEEGLGELRDEPQFAFDRVFCLLRGSEVAREQGMTAKAIDETEAALQVLKQPSFASELLELRAFMDLAESYRVAGRHREASAAFEQASARLNALGRDNTQTAGTLLNNWGLSLYLLGRPADAERLFRRAIAISSTGAGEAGVSPTLLVNNARALRDLGRLEEAAAQAERGGAKAEQNNDQIVMTQSVLLRASIYRMLGDLKRAGEMLAQADPLWRRTQTAGRMGLASMTSERALQAEARGDLPAAFRLANEAVSIIEALLKAGGPGADFLPLLLERRSQVALELHRGSEAVADASRALRMWQQGIPPGTLSSNLGRAQMALGRALQGEGKGEEAGAAFRAAAEHFADALGPDHPDSRRARQLLASAGQGFGGSR